MYFTWVEDHAHVALAHLIRDLLLEEGADGEVRLDGGDGLLNLLGRDGQPEVHIVASAQKNVSLTITGFFIVDKCSFLHMQDKHRKKFLEL